MGGQKPHLLQCAGSNAPALLQAPSSLLEASRHLLAPQPARPSLRARTHLRTSATSVPASKVT